MYSIGEGGEGTLRALNLDAEVIGMQTGAGGGRKAARLLLKVMHLARGRYLTNTRWMNE